MLWEAMIAEFRAVQLDLDARRHFTPEKHPIVETRSYIDDIVSPAAGPSPELRSIRSASSLIAAAETGSVEVG